LRDEDGTINATLPAFLKSNFSEYNPESQTDTVEPDLFIEDYECASDEMEGWLKLARRSMTSAKNEAEMTPDSPPETQAAELKAENERLKAKIENLKGKLSKLEDERTSRPKADEDGPAALEEAETKPNKRESADPFEGLDEQG